jgi:hypothetical protein
MAGQFDNWKKILSTSSSRPDVYMRDPEKDAEGNVTQVFPKIVAPAPTFNEDADKKTMESTGVTSRSYGDSMAVARQQKIDKPKIAASDKKLSKKGRALEAAQDEKEGLATTTMREYADGSVHDAMDMATTTMRPTPRGNVTDIAERPGKYGNPKKVTRTARPARQANPKYLAADVQRQNEDLAAATEADRRRSGVIRSDKALAEDSFNASEESSGSNLRSINGITYDLSEWKASGPKGINDSKPERPNASELEGATWADSLDEAKAKANFKPYTPPSGKISDYKPKKTAGEITAQVLTATPTPGVTEGLNKSDSSTDYEQDPTFTRVKKVKARKGGTLHGVKEVRDFETEHPDSDQSSAATGKTTAAANKNSSFTEPLAKPTKRTIVTEPARAVVEESISDSAHDLRASMSEGQEPDITSTTMREVPAEGPAAPVRIKDLPGKPIAAVPTRTSRNTAPYAKPTVNKPGYVIPPIAMDTFGTQEVDREQAEKERKLHVGNKIESTKTTILDPNERPAKPVAGQTPEAALIAASRREVYARELAGQKTPEGKPKELTTVHPAVLDTAKRLGLTDMYNLDKDYVNSTAFLAHPAIRKATVAHEYGVHHLLGTENDLLHQYLGEKPIEAEDRLARAYKIVDRKRRGNPESEPGEYEGLGAMIRAGSSPQQTLRAIRGGKKTDVTINGVTPTLAPGSSYNRSVTHDNAGKITDQVETAPKVALGSIAATPTAPLAGTGRIAVRRIGEEPEKAKIREFSPRELRNKKKYVPTSDDSKRKAGAGPVEETVNEESDIIDRLKKGPKYAEPFEF